MSDEDLENTAFTACPTCGSCSGMYTANSMNCLTESIGMSLPGSGTIPAVYSARLRLAKMAGERVMDLLKEDIKPSDIITEKSIENAMRCDMAIGCSTNTILHLTAIAHAAGHDINLDDLNEMGNKTPQICKLNPASSVFITDLNNVGGMQAVIKELSTAGLIHTDCLTVSGTVADRIAKAPDADGEVIRKLDNPFSKDGGIAVLKGNLAEEGAVVKKGAVAPEMMQHKGPAKCYNSEEEAIAAINGGKVVAGDVVVIRYEGPKGGPGMREMLSPTSAIIGMGLGSSVALLTDGRFPAQQEVRQSVMSALRRQSEELLRLLRTAMKSKSTFLQECLKLMFPTRFWLKEKQNGLLRSKSFRAILRDMLSMLQAAAAAPFMRMTDFTV